jgi:hypothetical protein
MPTITPVDVHQLNNPPPMMPTFYAKCSVSMGQGETLGFGGVRVSVWPTASPATVSTHTLFADGNGNFEQTNLPYPPFTQGPYQYKFEVVFSTTATSAVGNVQGS